MLSISECFCCSNRPQSPFRGNPPSDEEDEEAFSSAVKRFENMELPLKSLLEVHVAKVDPLPRKLRVDFSLRYHSAFKILHEQLHATYRNTGSPLGVFRVGTVCAVPLTTCWDYHRGIVKDVSNPSLPVVFYVDLGIERMVSRGCLRELHNNFFQYPRLHFAGEVTDSPLFDGRLRLRKKLLCKDRLLLKVDTYDKTKGRYLLTLDADSGIASDASP